MVSKESETGEHEGQPVVLSRIYTRTGDDGTTTLGDLSRVPKTDSRIEAYADVDEANCAIGAAIALGQLSDNMTNILSRIQNELFDLGADLCKPVRSNGDDESLRISEDYIKVLERECDSYNQALSTLRSFVLPGGTPGAALLHVARTIVRRAERSAWQVISVDADSVNPLTAKYLNRLSDLLFILARNANLESGDVLWKPGGERTSR